MLILQARERVAEGLSGCPASVLAVTEERIDQVGEDRACVSISRKEGAGLDRGFLGACPSLGGALRRERLWNVTSLNTDADGPADAFLAFALLIRRHAFRPLCQCCATADGKQCSR